jgi:class 3 adenylate cyclase
VSTQGGPYLPVGFFESVGAVFAQNVLEGADEGPETEFFGDLAGEDATHTSTSGARGGRVMPQRGAARRGGRRRRAKGGDGPGDVEEEEEGPSIVGAPEGQDAAQAVRHHAETMLRMAVDMHRFIKAVKHPLTQKPLQMRVGLHTGRVIAGVIGTRTLRYDIWGADVLAANLMESNAEADQICASETTADVLLDVPGLRFKKHKDVNVNDMGVLETFLVDAVDDEWRF